LDEKWYPPPEICDLYPLKCLLTHYSSQLFVQIPNLGGPVLRGGSQAPDWMKVSPGPRSSLRSTGMIPPHTQAHLAHAQGQETPELGSCRGGVNGLEDSSSLQETHILSWVVTQSLGNIVSRKRNKGPIVWEQQTSAPSQSGSFLPLSRLNNAASMLFPDRQSEGQTPSHIDRAEK